MAAIKDGNYLVIQSWMITELGLKDKELLLYSLIYGFTQNGEDWFCGSLQYIAEWLQIRRQNVRRYMDPLVEKGLIIKENYMQGNVMFVRYKAIKPTIENPGILERMDLIEKIKSRMLNSIEYRRYSEAGVEEDAVKAIEVISEVVDMYSYKKIIALSRANTSQINQIFKNAVRYLTEENKDTIDDPKKLIANDINKIIS